MGYAKGTYVNGVRDVASLKDRCRVDEVSGCWRYAGCCPKGRASIQIVFPDGRRTRARGRRVAVIVSTGKNLPTDVYAFPAEHCTYEDCVRPDHVALGTFRESRQAAARRGCYETPARWAHLAEMQQANRKLTPAQELEIAQSEAPTIELARRHGVSIGRVKQLRGGVQKARRRAASVFAWRP